MKVGFADQAEEGIESLGFDHCGPAPVFITVNACRGH
jgi:hypothetical protein